MPGGGIVFDTTSVLYLTIAGHDNLLADRYGGRAHIPAEVIEELVRGETTNGGNCARLLDGGWYRVAKVEEIEDVQLFLSLLRRWGREERNRGEAAAIVLARRHGYTAILDDRVGRNAATELGVRHTGTIGILIQMVASGTLTLNTAWLIHMTLAEVGFRTPLKDKGHFSLLVGRARAARAS